MLSYFFFYGALVWGVFILSNVQMFGRSYQIDVPDECNGKDSESVDCGVNGWHDIAWMIPVSSLHNTFTTFYLAPKPCLCGRHHDGLEHKVSTGIGGACSRVSRGGAASAAVAVITFHRRRFVPPTYHQGAREALV